MNMKTMALVLLFASAGANAAADARQTTRVPVETYGYSTHLDIAHVISTTTPANECAAVPVQMTYVDSHGERHVMEYQTMGTGCTN